MNDMAHGHAHALHTGEAQRRPVSWRMALSATAHCLAGCAIGEVAGMAIGTALGWGNPATIALAVVLAFISGYLLTLIPLRRAGLATGAALKVALAADTVSIAIMEVVDNLIMLAIPGAMDAGLGEPLFWGSLLGALLAAGVAALPVNRWLIGRGRGRLRVNPWVGLTDPAREAYTVNDTRGGLP